MQPVELPSRPPLVLIANDQEWSARSLESIMGPLGYAVLRAYNGRQALDLARSILPDVIILDAHMPDINGVDICAELRDDPRVGGATPIIITTSGPDRREERLAAFAAGAWEVCSQPLDGEVLLLKLSTWTRAKREVDRVRNESLLDEHTGLYNMRGLARRAREIGAEAYRQQHSLACVAFSPEPDVADEFGAAVIERIADRVVEHLAEVCRRTGRVSDAIGRLGPSEFAIIAPATEAKGAVRLVERLQESLRSSPVSLESGEERTLRIRAGYYAVPDYAHSSVDAVEMLLRAAATLRHLRTGGDSALVRAFDDVSVRFVH